MPKIISNVNENILYEGKKMLMSKNYKSFNIRELAKICNISVGTIYNNFSTKEDLVNAIFLKDWKKSLKKIENVNDSFETLKEKLYQVYIEMNNFVSTYISIFYEISIVKKSHDCPRHLESLFNVIKNIVIFERSKGTITSNLNDDKITTFILNNFLILCKDDSISFEDTYEFMNFK